LELQNMRRGGSDDPDKKYRDRINVGP
jgi:hypothetical protein